MLQWNQEAIPSVNGNVIGPPGIDIKDIAVASDGITIWAAPGTTVPHIVFKSTNSGITWTAVPTNVGGLTGINADLIAIAPDNSNHVAICDTTTLIVYVSTNGGDTWNTLGTIQEGTGATANSIKDLDISPAAMGINYVAVCGDDSDGWGNLWYFDVGAAAPIWRETNDLSGFNGSGYQASSVDAVAFSPNFPSDLVMVAITSNATASTVKLEIFSYTGDSVVRAWNSSAAFPSQYPISLSAQMSNPTFTAITKASIALDPEYLGSDDILRNAFIGLTLTGDEANSGIMRTKDVLAEDIKLGVNIYSIAYDGATLVAGATDAKIYRCKDPLATIPTFHSTSSLKRPGGMENAVVDFAGPVVFAGTTGPMSAFAVSIDDGASFNDISLIDTVLTVLEDVAISSDGSIIYLVTHDTFNTSIWRYDSTWKRVLSLTGVPVCLVRITLDNPDVIYIVSTTSTALYFSSDGGNRWFIRAARAVATEFAVEDNDIAYIGTAAGKVLKTTNSGFTWSSPTTTKLNAINSLTLISPGNLLAGGTEGNVAYTTDGNSTWNLIPKVVGSAIDKVNVTADGLAPGKNIYAVCSITAGVYRWTIGQDMTEPWLQVDNEVPGTGIVLKNGILYESSSASVVRRSILPTQVFDNIPTGTLVFDTTPSALRLSATYFIRLWAIDTVTMMLYSLNDTLAPVEPVVPVEPVLIVKKPELTLTGMKFFISYCDKGGLTFASNTAIILEANGPKAWYFDRDKTPGMQLIDDITNHIRDWCNKIIYICTNGSFNSDGQKKEMGQWYISGKQLIVIQIDKANVPKTIEPFIYMQMKSISFQDEFSIFVQNHLEKIINKWEEMNQNIKIS